MKVSRNYRFVLTAVDNSLLENGSLAIEQESRTGEFMFTSECHYYCEKEIISAVKEAEKRGALGEYYRHTYCIYKETKAKTVTTQEDDGKTTVVKELPTEAMLVEVITVDENGISIR